jgi:L-amino acid N-acyltransferase YncA
VLEAPSALRVGEAQLAHLEAIRRIYNEGIEDRVASRISQNYEGNNNERMFGRCRMGVCGI